MINCVSQIKEPSAGAGSVALLLQAVSMAGSNAPRESLTRDECDLHQKYLSQPTLTDMV